MTLIISKKVIDIIALRNGIMVEERFLAVLLVNCGVGSADRQSSMYHLYYSGWRRLAALQANKTPR